MECVTRATRVPCLMTSLMRLPLLSSATLLTAPEPAFSLAVRDSCTRALIFRAQANGGHGKIHRECSCEMIPLLNNCQFLSFTRDIFIPLDDLCDLLSQSILPRNGREADSQPFLFPLLRDPYLFTWHFTRPRSVRPRLFPSVSS